MAARRPGAINGVPFESAAKWEAGKLRVEKKFKGGLKVVELYAVSADPGCLTYFHQDRRWWDAWQPDHESRLRSTRACRHGDWSADQNALITNALMWLGAANKVAQWTNAKVRCFAMAGCA